MMKYTTIALGIAALVVQPLALAGNCGGSQKGTKQHCGHTSLSPNLQMAGTQASQATTPPTQVGGIVPDVHNTVLATVTAPPPPSAAPMASPPVSASAGNPAGWFYLSPNSRTSSGLYSKPVPYREISIAHGLVNPDGSLTQHAIGAGWVRLAPVATPALQQQPPQPAAQQVPQQIAQPMQVPQQVPTPTPQATPQPVPQIVAQPMQVPQQVPTSTPQATPQRVPQTVPSAGNPAGWFYLSPNSRTSSGLYSKPVPYREISIAHGLVNPDGSLTQHAIGVGWVRLAPVATPALQQQPPQPAAQQVPQTPAAQVAVTGFGQLPAGSSIPSGHAHALLVHAPDTPKAVTSGRIAEPAAYTLEFIEPGLQSRKVKVYRTGDAAERLYKDTIPLDQGGFQIIVVGTRNPDYVH